MNQQKILLLENLATQAAALREYLSQSGYQVAVSRHESDGLKRLVDWGPDQVIVSTGHPAGDFGEYCRRVRELAPKVRIIVTASLNRARLIQQYPGLQTIVDVVLLRPYSNEEVLKALAAGPVAARAASGAPPVEPSHDPGNAALRSEFQQQLDQRFLEIQELKRHLESANRKAEAAAQLEGVKLENERLRQGVQEARRKTAIALATEQLKRSEVEVEYDNLLKLKQDLEVRVQGEIEDRTREIEQVRGQLQELRERSGKEAGEHAALRDELERALVEKEQLEERLHTLEAAAVGPDALPAALERIAVLEAELSRQRALEAEGRVALAETASQLAVLEETRARESAARQESESLAAEIQRLRAETAEAQRGAAALQAKYDTVQDRLVVAENSATAAQAELLVAGEHQETLARELAQARAAHAEVVRQAEERDTARAAELEKERAARAAAEQLVVDGNARLEAAGRLGAEAAEHARELARERDGVKGLLEERQRVADGDILVWREKAAAAERELGVLRSQREQGAAGREEERRDGAARLEKALRDLEESTGLVEVLRSELAKERDGVKGLLEERQRVADGDILVWREKAAIAERELEVLRSQREQGAAGREQERRDGAARLEKALRDLEESERRVEVLRGELSAAAEAHEREGRLLAERTAAAEAVSRESGDRLAVAEAALVATRQDFEARQRVARTQLETEQAALQERERKLAVQAAAVAEAGPVQAELQRIQELLEEVISRARVESVDYARRDAELTVRLQAALEERRLLQERFDRAGAEATERERRSASLLQSAIDHGPLRAEERANLPAVVPLTAGSGTNRRRLIPAVLAVVALAALLALIGLWRTGPPAVPEPPAVPRSQPGDSSAARGGPGTVWDRFTRSDTSGGVFVQATLRGEDELLAEVEAARADSASDEEVRAEFARRLSAFRFDTTYYMTVYLKNLTPGYPAYLDDLPGRFRLRDSSGGEVQAFLPPGHDADHRVFSFGAGTPADLVYEASVSLGFDRAGLSPSTGYLQLVVSDVGTTSRRVLTWELE